MQYDLLTDEGFEQYVDSIDERLLASSEGRRALCELDPLAFALIYLPHHLRGEQTADKITFADLHVALIEYAKTMVLPTTRPRQNRDAFVAPRETGKSTWLFLIIPLWEAAFGHKKFIAAFADTGPQSLIHLATFKRELENNDLLREDFPELCTPAIRDKGQTTFDTKKEYQAQSGFVFMARGVDAGIVGMKFGAQRPDHLILDDIEPLEANYSLYQVEQRLSTVLEGVFGLNEFAHVTIAGTVTRTDSIIHQLVKTITQPNEEQPSWIAEQNIRVHYFAPLVPGDDGELRSIWPQKWSKEYLLSIAHTRAYLKNFLNDPMGKDGDFWTNDDFTHQWLDDCNRTVMWIDPHVKKGAKSDPTGLAVVSYRKPRQVRPAQNGLPAIFSRPMCMVEWADDTTKTGSDLRDIVLKVLEQFPHISVVIVEDNQGGDLWKDILHDLPVKLKLIHESKNKDTRAENLHNLYQSRQVVHAERLHKAEAQMVMFKGKNVRGTNDDIIDAIGGPVLRWIKPKKKAVAKAGSSSYL